FFASVDLPDGATLSALRIVARNGGGSPLEAHLYRTRLGTTDREFLAAVRSGTYPGWDDITTSTFADPVVDTDAYAYHVEIGAVQADASADFLFQLVEIAFTS